MNIIHRLVIVIAGFGAFGMVLLLQGSQAIGLQYFALVALPGLAIAAIAYPLCWIIAGPRLFRRR